MFHRVLFNTATARQSTIIRNPLFSHNVNNFYTLNRLSNKKPIPSSIGIANNTNDNNSIRSELFFNNFQQIRNFSKARASNSKSARLKLIKQKIAQQKGVDEFKKKQREKAESIGQTLANIQESKVHKLTVLDSEKNDIFKLPNFDPSIVPPEVNLTSLPITLATADNSDIMAHRIRETIKKFRESETDTGSASVQIAVLTERIHNFARHITEYKKDVMCKRQFQILLNRRKKMMKYLRSKDFEKFRETINVLGLRKEALELPPFRTGR